RSAAKPVARRGAKLPSRKPARTSRPTRRTPRRAPRRASGGLRTLPIPPARPKKRSARAARRRGAGVATTPVEQTVFDAAEERTRTDEPVAGAVVERWSVEPSAPPAAALRVESPEGDATDVRRYFAVVSEVPGVEVVSEAQPAPSAGAARRGRDRYATDLPTLVVSAALAASTFLPWYKGPKGFGIH